MSIISDKKMLVQILFGIAVLVLVANLVADKFLKKNNAAFIEGMEELNTLEIQKRFIASLHTLGIIDLWIDTVKSKNESPLEFSYQVSIPKDLPIALAVNEIDNSFNPEEALILSEEKVMGGKTILKIFSGNKIKLISELNYNDKIKRTAGKAGFLLRLGGKDIDTVLLKYPESFALLLVPSRSAAELVEEVVNSRKEYAIYLNDDISELDYKLDKNYSNARLKNSIREIIGSFSSAVFVLVDDKSNLYSSGVFSFVEEELLKRKIKLIKESSLTNIGSDKDIVSQFRNILKSTSEDKAALIIISNEDFLTIRQEIISYRKIGYKFVTPSDIVIQDGMK